MIIVLSVKEGSMHGKILYIAFLCITGGTVQWSSSVAKQCKDMYLES